MPISLSRVNLIFITFFLASKVHTSELLKQAGKPYPNDGFHHSIQVPSLLKVMPVVDSICRIQSPR